MALLAYEEPEKSPMFHLLSFEYRQHVADSLNRAILGVYIFFVDEGINVFYIDERERQSLFCFVLSCPVFN